MRQIETGRSKRNMVLWAALMMGAAVSLTTPERVRRIGFCAPAAHVAARATGSACTTEPDGYRLWGPAHDLIVVPACAAVDFFCLVAGFLSALMAWRGWRPAAQWTVLPLAWVITIAANAVRLASCWQADRWARLTLPPTLWPGLHLATGLATFLLALIAVYWGMSYRKTKTI